MSVTVDFQGRLGNNLFQYAFARIVAESHSLQLVCKAPRRRMYSFAEEYNLNVGPEASLPDLNQRFPNAPLKICGRSVEGPVVRLDDALTASQFYDVLRGKPCRFKCRGFFQRIEYYAPFRNEISRWFAFKSVPTPFDIKPNDVLVNIRAGFDFDVRGWTLPLSFYKEVLSILSSTGQVYFCGTGINRHICAFFKRYNAVHYDGTPSEHFSFFKRFNRIVISNSTFAWWAAYLSDASEVYGPHIRQGGTVQSNIPMVEVRYHGVPVDLEPRPPRVLIKLSASSETLREATKSAENDKTAPSDANQIPTFERWIEAARSQEYINSTAWTGQTLEQWIKQRVEPFGLVDIPPHFLRDADCKPAKLLKMVFNTGLVKYLPSDEVSNTNI